MKREVSMNGKGGASGAPDGAASRNGPAAPDGAAARNGPAARPLAVITDDRFGDSSIERSILEAAGVELRVAKCRSSAELAEAGRAADALLVNLAPADAQAIEALERCKVIARYGVGLDNVDLPAASRRGIAVRNVPGYCDLEVAEHALGLILSLARAIPARDAAIRAGRWGATAPGRRVAGSVLGILGFGGTARALARMALGLRFSRILVWSPHISAERIGEALGAAPELLGCPVEPAGFEELLGASDWTAVHLPLKPETRGIIGAREFGLMKGGSILVNVARGAVVEESALVEALRRGRLGGAGLDVFTAEPLVPASPLRSLPNVVLSDHAAYASRESLAELRRRTAENVVEELGKAGLLA
jgi:D-3-phosphoglycerate dehydrogenase